MLTIAFLVLLLEQGIRNQQYLKVFVAYHLTRLSSAR